MPSVTRYKIADLVSEISMGPFGSNIKTECFVDFGIPVLNGSNLVGFTLNEDRFNYVTEAKADSLGKANAHRGDVIVTHRGTLGQIAYIPKASKFDRYVISQSQFRFTCNDLVLPEYITYYFHTKLGQHQLLSNASQVGVPALARATSTFKSIQIEIPEINTQRKVVEILESIEKKIALNNRINGCLFSEALTCFDRFYDSSKEETPLSSILDVLGGGTPKTKVSSYWEGGQIPFFGPGDVTDTFCITTEKHITEDGLNNCNSSLYSVGTTFITARGTVGKTAIVGVPMAMNQSCFALKGKKVSDYLVYLYVQKALRRLLGKANGAVFDALTSKDIKNEVIYRIPDTKEKEIDAAIAPLFDLILANQLENEGLSLTRDSLLPKLMSGEIGVDDIEV